MLRSRAFYGVLTLATIALGLIVHWNGSALGPTTQDVLGDGIWAAMIVWCVSAVSPGAPIRNRALVALAICFAVELSQLYHAPGLDAVRRTTIGQLTLGSGFDPRDLLAYSLGVITAVLFERTARRYRRIPER
jgi:hypothetical protein